MITTVKIMDMAQASAELGSYNNNYTAWISTVDPEDGRFIEETTTLCRRKNIPFFHRYFRDYEDGEVGCDIHGAERSDIEYIINFLKGLKAHEREHHIGINCLAGICRSTAIGMIAWMIAGFNPEVALQRVLTVRSGAWPNERVLRLADEILGTNSQKDVAEFKKNNRQNLFINPAWNSY